MLYVLDTAQLTDFLVKLARSWSSLGPRSWKVPLSSQLHCIDLERCLGRKDGILQSHGPRGHHRQYHRPGFVGLW